MERSDTPDRYTFPSQERAGEVSKSTLEAGSRHGDREHHKPTHKEREVRTGRKHQVVDQRSLQANKYYWGVVIPHSSNALIYAGWERERFAHTDLVHAFWKDLLKIDSTSSLSTSQFTEYIDHIIRICAVYLDYSIPISN